MRSALRARVPIVAVALALVGIPSAYAAADIVLQGTPGDDVIVGTAVGESIYGRAGNDTINGGGGDDELDGGPGADRLSGGDGSDAVSYGAPGVAVTLDGLANDGVPGEADNVALDVEDVFGGDGDDRLTGSPAANVIDGGAGADRIEGAGGRDDLYGGDGPDTIVAQDGEVDRVSCGEGADTAVVDRVDVVAADCEGVVRPQITITPGLTIVVKGSSRRFIVSSVVSKSSLSMYCVGCGKKPVRIVRKSSVRLSKGVVAFSFPSKIRGKVVELGVKAPKSEPRCVRYKITSRYRYTVDRKRACVSKAKQG